MKKLKKWLICLSLTAAVAAMAAGCGNNNGDNTTDESNVQDTDANNDNNNLVDDVEDGIENGINDVENGVEDLTDDLDGNAYNDYDSAHDYLMNQLNNDNSGKKYEVRNRDESVTEYLDGKKGYHYEIYDVTDDANAKKEGDFYVDRDSGKIYKKNSDTNKIEEY